MCQVTGGLAVLPLPSVNIMMKEWALLGYCSKSLEKTEIKGHWAMQLPNYFI